MKASDLVGAWRLLDFRIDLADRAPVHPLGTGGQGLLVYTEDGHVSAVLCGGDRPALGVDGLETAHRADATAKARAFDSYTSYAGRYHLDGDEVVHTVQLALLPDVVGREQRRRVTWDGDTLILSYEVPHPAGARRYRLAWTRAETP